MKKRIVTAGGFIGILFSIWDSVIDKADSALSEDHLAGFIFHSVFSMKTFVYLLIGGVSGWIISLMIHKINELYREWNDF
ncbi:hypothetical protein ACR1PO_04855 [Chryseobacterium sp. RRHN12]|uniref:hypothetical protein n=1 Tax=Chryseobacterium sp. RRHN12 TaxID=3437884 RepID=UPI002FCC9F4E